MTNEIKTINTLFEKSFTEIESKMKELFINDIKIHENIKSIENYESKSNYLDNIIIDRKQELKILKQLLLLKEQKKLNFEYIISKYLIQIISSTNKNNQKIEQNFNLNEKKKRVNSIIKNFSNEFNFYLTKDKNNKKKLHRYNSDLFNKELNKKNISNILNNDINNNIVNINNKPNIININTINININENYENKSDGIHGKKIEDKKDKNAKRNIINYIPNKNLKKSRENLEYYLMKNNKDKPNKNIKLNYTHFTKLIFEKIVNHINRNNKSILVLLYNIYIKIKLKDLLCFNTLKNLFLSKIITFMKKSSDIYNNKENEIQNDDEFLENINLNFNEYNNMNNIDKYKNNLMELKNINKEINDINGQIIYFIGTLEGND